MEKSVGLPTKRIILVITVLRFLGTVQRTLTIGEKVASLWFHEISLRFLLETSLALNFKTAAHPWVLVEETLFLISSCSFLISSWVDIFQDIWLLCTVNIIFYNPGLDIPLWIIYEFIIHVLAFREHTQLQVNNAQVSD